MNIQKKIQRNARKKSYYMIGRKENLLFILEGLFLCLFIGWIFYENLFSGLIFTPLIYCYRQLKIKECQKKMKWNLNLEFGEGLQNISASLNAGYAPEHAIREGMKDLKLLYNQESMIIKEFDYMINQINMNISIDEAFFDFARRSEIDDIMNFAEVFATAKQRGGDLIQVIQITCRSIHDKVEVKREIITLISAKKLEANLMKWIPIAIILYLKLTSPNYLSPLYQNLIGNILMTAILIIYLLSIVWINKIMDIEL